MRFTKIEEVDLFKEIKFKRKSRSSIRKFARSCYRAKIRKEVWTRPTEIHLVSIELRKKRLAYLRFRVRVVGTAAAFILMMRKKIEI